MTIINKLITAGIFLAMMFVFALAIPGVVQAQYSCNYHSYERCMGNNLYWYDSCGNAQDLVQYCQNGCYNNACQNNYNNYNNYNNNNNYNSTTYNGYGSCTYHAYKLCIGSNVYWYDSCGTQQDLIATCSAGQTCNDVNNPASYGQCTTPVQNYNPPANNYTAHARTACSGNSIEWFDSLGAASGLYKNCQDANTCTLDSCSADKCSNILKCDGTTCATGSADFNTYCATAPAPVPVVQTHCGNGLCETTIGETNANCPSDCKIAGTTALSVSFFSKQDSSSDQWQKTAQVPSDSQIYFMISVVNNSATQADNVVISANIPNEISSLGNLQLNGVPVTGDIVSGIDIGSIAPSVTKSVTFEGKTQTISASATKQATATSNVSGATQSDIISISLIPATAAIPAAVSKAPATSGFWGFLGKWYLWILGALVLIFLFIMVFKRFSSDV